MRGGNRVMTWLAPAIGPLCLLVMFAGVLTGSQRLAFRDVSYFYTPLYAFVAQQSAIDRPVWNPLDQTGMPLAGETTTAVYYPVRMLVYAPGWTAETAIGVYVWLHLVIASLAAYFVARRWRCRPMAAAVAGVVYPLSGIVLFLATNPPFLVGAAWLPLVLSPLISPQDRRLVVPRIVVPRIVISRIVIPGVAMAMMILGGDPPTALHALIIAGVVKLFRMSSAVWSVGLRRAMSTRWRAGVLPLLAAPVLASVLAAPQIAASLAWSACSDRVQRDSAPGEIGTPANAPENSTSRRHAFAFSVAPWRWAETVVPNLYGTPWPVNSRWDRLVFDGGVTRPETSLWTPSLYGGGLIPFALLCGGGGFVIRRYRGRATRWQVSRDWPWWVVLGVGGFASMGSFAPVYGVLYDYLPGYDSLRYPSKWLPMVALAVALLAAGFVERWGRGDSKRKDGRSRINREIVVCVFVAASVGAAWIAIEAIGRLTLTTSDPFWGPFMPGRAIDQVGRSAVHVVLIGTALIFAAWWRGARRWVWTAIVVVDLMVAHQGFVPQIDRNGERRIINAVVEEGLEEIAEEIAEGRSRRWMRLHRDGGFPGQWAGSSNDQRMLFVDAAQRQAWFGRWHLEHGHGLVNSMVSIGPREMAEFWVYARRVDHELENRESNGSGSSRSERWRGWCEMLGVDGYVQCGGDDRQVSFGEVSEVMPSVRWEDCRSVLRTEREPDQRNRLGEPSETVLALPEDRAAAWRAVLMAYAEPLSEPGSQRPAFVSRSIADSFAADFENADAGEKPTLVSRRVYQDGNWRAFLVSQIDPAQRIDAEVFPVDFLSQGVRVPPGRWRVEFIYSPWWHGPAMAISFAGWFGVFLVGFRFLAGFRRSRNLTRRRWPF